MNYIGSKYTLLDFLEQTISKVTGFEDNSNFVFCDLFAGTGVVGATYKKKGYYVISNDIQYYSYVINKHYIENCHPVNVQLLKYLNELNGTEGYIYNNYCAGSGSGRNYFSDLNGKKCDSIRLELEMLYNSNQIDESTYFFYLASLINSIDKYANTASVYGAFLKHIKSSAQKEFKLELLPVIDGNKGITFNEDANELIKKISGDILYLDPPYNARQYCTNYHVLETIAKYDNPVLHGKTGLREYSKQKSNFCSKKTVLKVFDDLIFNAKFKYIFLSYNNEGLMTFDDIKEIMSKYGEYSCHTKEHRRFRSDKDKNRNVGNKCTIEFLHCLIKEK